MIKDNVTIKKKKCTYHYLRTCRMEASHVPEIFVERPQRFSLEEESFYKRNGHRSNCENLMWTVRKKARDYGFVGDCSCWIL